MDLSHRDVIREADGIGMMSMWRINMLRFWNGHHYKYLRVGHRLLAGINFMSCATSLNLQGLKVILGPIDLSHCITLRELQ